MTLGKSLQDRRGHSTWALEREALPPRPGPSQEAVTQDWAASCRIVGSPEALLCFANWRCYLPVAPLQPDHAQVCPSVAGVGPNTGSEEHQLLTCWGWRCEGLGADMPARFGLPSSEAATTPAGGRGRTLSMAGPQAHLARALPTVHRGRHGEAGHHQTHCEASVG